MQQLLVSVSQPLLFSNASIFDVMASQKEGLRAAIHNLPALSLDDDGLHERLVTEFGINVPILEEEKKYAKKRPTEIDVSRDPMRRFLYGHAGPHYVQGTELSIYVPFLGDPELFQVRPSSFDTNPPRGETVGNELCLVYTFMENGSLDEYQRAIASVKRYLDWLRPSAAQLHRELEQQARSMLDQRKNREEEHAKALGALGIPILDDHLASDRLPAETARSVPQSTRAARNTRKANRVDWDVFISHASEDKADIARPLADALQTRGVSVWYDEFSLKLGDSLRKSIDHGLLHSKFGAVILSPRFFEKHWPQQELNGLAIREADGKKVILPIWHNVGFEDVRQYSPMLADRIGVSTKEGLEKVVEKVVEAIR